LINIRRAKIEDDVALRALSESMPKEDEPWIRENVTHFGKEREWIQNMVEDDRAHSTDGGKFLFFALEADILVGHVNGMSWVHAPREVFEKMTQKYGLVGEKPGHVGIAMHKDYRRQGIGSKLMDVALQELRDMGVTVAIVAVRIDNKISFNFFNKKGFAVLKSEGKHVFLKKKIDGEPY